MDITHYDIDILLDRDWLQVIPASWGESAAATDGPGPSMSVSLLYARKLDLKSDSNNVFDWQHVLFQK